MIRVNQLIRMLKEFPSDANAYAYEGEVCGIIVVSKNGGKTLGIIDNNGNLKKYEARK